MLQCKLSQQENMNIIFLMLEGASYRDMDNASKKKNMFFLI